VTIATALPPLAFVSAFGTTMIYAWTGQSNPQIRLAICLVSLAYLPKAVSLLQLVLYRASGRALHDNISQIIRIVLVLIIACFATRLGFGGVMAGMAFAEFVGVIFMIVAMSMTFHAFNVKVLMEDAFRITAATVLVLGAVQLATMIPLPWTFAPRAAALVKLGEIGLGCLLMAWPALMITNTISSAERRSLLDSVMPGRRRVLQANH
jgi:hypothetical protein